VTSHPDKSDEPGNPEPARLSLIDLTNEQDEAGNEKKIHEKVKISSASLTLQTD